MKTLILTFLVFFNSYLFSQQFDSQNFNSSEMNKALLKQINIYRKSKGLDTLVYSQVVFDSISYQNCNEVAISGGFYHPDIHDKWKHSTLREMIVKESYSKIGGGVMRHSSGLPWLETWENAFRVHNYISSTSYDELAKFAIKSWETSPSHNRVQNMSFSSNGLPGMFSCHSVYAKNGYIYIYINYVMVHREYI